VALNDPAQGLYAIIQHNNEERHGIQASACNLRLMLMLSILRRFKLVDGRGRRARLDDFAGALRAGAHPRVIGASNSDCG
jgi:hypothetical protein